LRNRNHFGFCSGLKLTRPPAAALAAPALPNPSSVLKYLFRKTFFLPTNSRNVYVKFIIIKLTTSICVGCRGVKTAELLGMNTLGHKHIFSDTQTNRQIRF